MTPETRKALRNYAFVLAIFGFMAGGYVYVAMQPKPDEKTLCHPEHPPKNHTIILIDKTDAIPNSAEEKIRSLILGEKKALSQFDRLSIYQLVGHPIYGIMPIFSLCNPGNRETASPFYENPLMVQMNFEANFETPLNDALDDIANIPPADASPIMEALKKLSALDDNADPKPYRHFIIISDMLQNVDAGNKYSQYKTHENFATFAKRPYAKTIAPDFEHSNVTVKYIARLKYLRHQGDWHPMFWETFFKTAGADTYMHESFVTIDANGKIYDDD